MERTSSPGCNPAEASRVKQKEYKVTEIIVHSLEGHASG